MQKLPFIFFLLISFTSHSQSGQKINFDNNWKFHLGHAADATKDFNYSIATIFSKSGKAVSTAIDPKFNDDQWRSLDLPHDWAVELPFENADNFDVMSHGYKPVGGLYPQNSIGWYRKHFMVNRSDSGKHFSLQFDGVFRDCTVWINGFYLGNNFSGYTGFEFDITDYLNFNKQNVIVVRVDASQYEGWFYEGAGIYRHVWLNMSGDVKIPTGGLFVHTDVKNKTATVFLQTEINNKGDKAANAILSSVITTTDGKKIASINSSVIIPSNGSNTVQQKILINDPKLWGLEDPYLYRVISTIKNGNAIDTLVTKFGIRTITIDAAQGLFLNGKHLKVQGVNCHQDHAGLGSALPDYLQYYRIGLLKEMGTNAYRTSHHAPTPELLDACDSLGMLVLDEQRLLNSSPEYMSQFEGLLKRDRNRPSVFLWSIGNEEGYIHTTGTGKRIAISLLQKQKELDPTRVSTYAADFGNIFHGVNEVIPVRGFNYRQGAAADYHRDHPNQPLIGTEMGSTVTTRGIYTKDTVIGYVPDQDITAPWWASKAEDWWTLAADNTWWMGGFIWTGFDYRGEPTPFKWPNINSHFGVMDMCGFPKNIYYYYQSWWTDKDVLHISPHWNWSGKEGQLINIWVNTNADDVELFLNGKSQGKKIMPRNRHLEWNVPYEAGKLEAIAFKHGRKLTAKVETTGPATELVMTPYKTTILADGKDATVLNIHAIDREGREVPDADNLVKFSIKGNGEIIGVGNGDPSSHEPDKCETGKWQRKLFNGKCQFIIQSGKSPSVIDVEATAEKLWAAKTSIHSVIPQRALSPIPDKPSTKKIISKMLGADISWLPELEARGMKFSDSVHNDAIEILKAHGFNYVRLRIFNEPARDSGYSPKKGFCDMQHTKEMAKRVKAAGMKFLLDFHYSDYWADPGKQFKPESWKGLDAIGLRKAVYEYTKKVLLELEAQGTLPDMVQVGNEINHGMIWPDGHINHPDTLAELLKAGYKAVREVDPSIITMIHIALGGQHDESVYFLDNMTRRGVDFDVIGFSYYPKWHGTLSDLQNNLTAISKQYSKDVIVVEYSQMKKEVNDIIFNLPGDRGRGSCIWEPLNYGEQMFDWKSGKANELLKVYDEVSRKYLR